MSWYFSSMFQCAVFKEQFLVFPPFLTTYEQSSRWTFFMFTPIAVHICNGPPFRLSFFSRIWQPPIFPHRPQCSIFGRLSLNHRVRDGNGCFPQTHRHQKLRLLFFVDNQTVKQPLLFSLERRWSSRTFRYGYLVTTSPQLSYLPSAAPSLRLGHWLRAFTTPMVWRAVCTRPGNVFTATCWFAITSDSSFM